MRILFLILLLSSCSTSKITTIENYQGNKDISWGSVSAQSPNYGFYGQEFEFQKNTKIESISVFVFDHEDYDETKATINFSIWEFEEKPMKELFISKKVEVLKNEIDNWKTYKFKKPFQLKKGKYLFAVGQPDLQGFIAFGNGLRKNGYSGSLWMKSPMGEIIDGTEWLTIVDIMKSLDPNVPDNQLIMFYEACVMMKLEIN